MAERKIILIDNASPNGSGERLQELYKDNSDIDIILNTKNLGFAKGNNIGYKFAREKYNPDFIVIINNDIEIIQNNFVSKLNEIYQMEKFDILGPDIVSTETKTHQSPKSLDALTYRELQIQNNRYKSYLNSQWKVHIRCALKKIPRLKKLKYHFKNKKSGIDYNRTYYNVTLQGSCFIFSKQFIEKKELAFYEGTFLYYESEILNFECLRDKLKTMYSPQLYVNHHHNVATNKAFKSEVDKFKFTNNCAYESSLAFLNLINGG